MHLIVRVLNALTTHQAYSLRPVLLLGVMSCVVAQGVVPWETDLVCLPLLPKHIKP